MTKQLSKNSSFTDSALLIATITASLFIVGYLHEGPFLEKFGLKNEEFIPSSATLITYGFEYLFINLITYTVIASFAVMFFSIIALIFKDEILGWLRKRIKSNSIIELKTFIIYSVILTIPFLATLASIKVIKDGAKEYDEHTKLKHNLDILITTNEPTGINGKVIRFHNNKIAFFDIKTKIARIFPDSQVIELKYSVPQENN